MDVLSSIPSLLDSYGSIVQATIIAASGSIPLPPGASMVFGSHGLPALGTIGGGMLEATVTKEVTDLSEAGVPYLVRRYDLDEGEVEGGMICGGTASVLIERLTREDISLYSRALVLTEQSGECSLVRAISSDDRGVRRFVFKGDGSDAEGDDEYQALLRTWSISPEEMARSFQRAQRKESVETITCARGLIVIQHISGVQPLIIFGGGHVGRAVSKIAVLCGFSVTVVDDRGEYARADRFPEAVRTIARSWKDAFQELSITPSASIVIVTRGHESDKAALRLAVKTPARYIGMIGSGRKVAATYKQLQEEGVSGEALRRVHAPIGLSIGSVTAEEIAVSIVAELIAVRRGALGNSGSGSLGA